MLLLRQTNRNFGVAVAVTQALSVLIMSSSTVAADPQARQPVAPFRDEHAGGKWLHRSARQRRVNRPTTMPSALSMAWRK
jgi:hypothetical protein